jgi:hypothetical protein
LRAIHEHPDLSELGHNSGDEQLVGDLAIAAPPAIRSAIRSRCAEHKGSQLARAELVLGLGTEGHFGTITQGGVQRHSLLHNESSCCSAEQFTRVAVQVAHGCATGSEFRYCIPIKARKDETHAAVA